MNLVNNNFYNDITSLLKNAKNRVYQIINATMTQTYWEIGKRIVEEDKRDSYNITLPYSKKLFSVPSNLFIIASMNTADKSIATIDIALRRRFTFLRLEPNENLVPTGEKRDFFKKANDYIDSKLGKDYLLGHSYFMSNAHGLDFIKEYKVKPLLEEYFYAENKSGDEILKEIEEYNKG